MQYMPNKWNGWKSIVNHCLLFAATTTESVSPISTSPGGSSDSISTDGVDDLEIDDNTSSNLNQLADSGNIRGNDVCCFTPLRLFCSQTIKNLGPCCYLVSSLPSYIPRHPLHCHNYYEGQGFVQFLLHFSGSSRCDVSQSISPSATSYQTKFAPLCQLLV